LHAHLTISPLAQRRLQPLARRVLNSLRGADQALLRARLLAMKARRSRPCLREHGSRLFAAAESRMLLLRLRDAFDAYERALRQMNRDRAARVLPEVITLLRSPYERLAALVDSSQLADLDGAMDLLPPGLLRAAKQLAHSLSVELPEAALTPISRTTRRSTNADRRRLWLEGDELLIIPKDAQAPLRLRGDAAAQALEQRLVPDDPDVIAAARATGQLGIEPLLDRLVFLSQLDDPAIQRAGWLGRLGMAAGPDHKILIRWLLSRRPEVTSHLASALRRFSDRAGTEISKIPPSRWPIPVLKAMLADSSRYDRRAWYSATLQHQDLSVRVLAHASMRRLKPEDWLTARLDKAARCAAQHLRALAPAPRRTAPKPEQAAAASTTANSLISEEIEDSAGSVQIPDDADPTKD
jgi:hypothetical protein